MLLHGIREGEARDLGDLATDDRVRLESEAESDGETSALVVDIGAIAMYPAIIPPRTDYRSTLRTIAHEWVHHYLYFTPLGRSFYDSDRLVTLNETVANVAGDELGDIVWSRYPLERPPALVSAQPMPPLAEIDTQEAFDYREEMHELRLEVDALLAQGRIDEAEALMEDRRQEFAYGKPFVLYKFRTMRVDAESQGARLAVPGDPRVTPVGRFLRLTRLDELPQLWNVLRGDMSLVGPRPERPEFIETLSQHIPGYLQRLGLKPGLTGLAQILNGYDNNLAGFRRKVALDLLYLQNCCLWNDLKILWRTIGVVLTGKGAL